MSICLPTEITDEMVDSLLKGSDTTTLVFYDVSDRQLYGCKKKRVLKASWANKAGEAGCIPTVYQATHWLCLVYIPVWPLGTYLVMQENECDDPDGDAVQYRCIRIATDWGQIFIHYICVAIVVTTAAVIAWRFSI